MISNSTCPSHPCLPHAQRRGDGRTRVVVAAVLLAWLVLAGRLVQLQVLGRVEFSDLANRQRSFAQTIPARPGEILDRRGRLLATTITARSVYVVPRRIVDPADVASKLATVLDVDAGRLTERIVKHRRRHFLWVKRRLEQKDAEAVRELHLPDDAWGFREEYTRRYPQGRLAAHVVGFRNIDGEGRGGIEQGLDDVLKGEPGRRVLVRDARGRVIDVRDDNETEPRHGRSVVLTIDSVLQLYVERELDALSAAWKPHSACAIVLDPKTGEVLASASVPTFNPDDPGRVVPEAWKNTCIASVYEPGSTFKPLVAAWAVDRDVVDRDELLDCEYGAYRMGPRTLHDHHPYGRLSVADVLVKSSNIGMAKIGERLTNEGLYRCAIAFGFGRPTGCRLPGELAGIVRARHKWDVYSTGSVPMGQEIAVTPMQLIAAHAALANGGKLVTPRLVLHTTDAPVLAGGTATAGADESAVTSRVVGEDAAHWVVSEPMVDVVTRGTGRKAVLEGYRVFGKTGTAQKIDPETKQYSHTRHVCSFICGAPADDPRVLVLVVVDEPTAGTAHGGGTVAAPSAARILKQTLQHLHVPLGKQ